MKKLPDHHQRLRDERLKRDAEMLALREAGETFEKIGERYGISRARAHQIVSRAAACKSG